MFSNIKSPTSFPTEHIYPSRTFHLFQKYPKIYGALQLQRINTNGSVTHKIDTGDRNPVFARPRPLCESKLISLRTEFKHLLEAGIIRPSNSPWASPLHMVAKPGTDRYRAVGDYRALNKITKRDSYPLPHIQTVTNKLANMKHFSKIDMRAAYHQIPMAPQDIPKTAITTPLGLMEYVTMPYGLRSSASTFQRYMDTLFRNETSTFVYIDDILIFSPNETQHLADLENVLKILNDNNLRISPEKCEINVPEIEFLGYTVNQKGIKPNKKNLMAIENYQIPNDSQKLRRFLGLVNFYRRLLCDFAKIAYPLTELMKKYPNSKILPWNDAAQQSFDEIKSMLLSLTELPHPNPTGPLHMVCDASQHTISGALHQIVNTVPIPIGFFSQKLSDTERKYSTFDRELLAAYKSVLHFRPLIDGRQVTLFTDHKPLVSSYNNPKLTNSDRQTRHLMILSEYISHVEHIRGADNIVADALTRHSINKIELDCHDLNGIARAQVDDSEITTYKERLKAYPLSDKTVIWCDISTTCPRPFVPTNLRQDIFNSLHSLCHPGISRSQKLIKARYFWPSMDQTIKKLCIQCLSCQRSKIIKHTKTPITNIAPESNRFEDCHIDLVGPLPPSKRLGDSYTSSERYLLTMIDRSTRWMEAIPINDIKAETVANAFLNNWISRYGVPLYVHTDRGSQFEAELFSELSKIIGFHRLRTTSYHPQSNGFVERLHRTLKTAVIARGQDWLQSLPIILLGLRAIPNEYGFSLFEAVTGTKLLSPKISIDKNTDTSKFNQHFIKELATRMKEIDFMNASSGTTHNRNTNSYVPPELQTCTHVWIRIDRVRRSLESPYSGPYLVISRHLKYFTIQFTDSSKDNISLDRLKPATIPTPNNNKLATADLTHTKTVMNEDAHTPIQPKVSRSGRRVRFNPQNDFHYF